MNIVFCIYNVIINKLATLVEYLEEDYLSACLSIRSDRLACEKTKSVAVFQACHKLRDLFVFIENRSLTKSPSEIVLKAEQLKLSSYFEFRSNDSVTVGNFRDSSLKRSRG